MAKNFLKEVMDIQEQRPINHKALIEKIESGYLKGPQFFKKKTFSPSKLIYGSGACPRYWFIAFTGAEFDEKNSPYEIANMSSGTMSHERIQKAIENSGILVDKEKKIITSDPPIYGSVDAIIQWGEDQPVVEIKTMKEDSFAYRKYAKPANYHLMQLIIYMKVLGKKLGLLLYENKNSHELHAITVEMTDVYDNWVEYAFDWMKKVYAKWQSNEIPQKPYRSNSKVCKTCPVQKACYAAPKGDEKMKPLEYLE